MSARLDELLAARTVAKTAEDAAIEVRKALDVEIVEEMRVPGKSEGTVNYSGGGFTAKAVYAVDRKVDADKLIAGWGRLSAVAQAAFRWKAEVNARGYKALKDADLQVAAEFVESKDKTPTLKIEAA